MMQTMFMQTVPPGEMSDLICEGCGCTTFRLTAEKQDDQIVAFHTLCNACGKRGLLESHVKIGITRQFLQFSGYLPDVTGNPPTSTRVPDSVD